MENGIILAQHGNLKVVGAHFIKMETSLEMAVSCSQRGENNTRWMVMGAWVGPRHVWLWI